MSIPHKIIKLLPSSNYIKPHIKPKPKPIINKETKYIMDSINKALNKRN